MANYLQTGDYNGLGTFNIGVPTTGDYNLQGWLTLPTYIGPTQESEVVVTITVNGGAAIYTGHAGDKGFDIKYAATALDIFNVTLTSSADIDKQKNAIRTTITIGEI